MFYQGNSQQSLFSAQEPVGGISHDVMQTDYDELLWKFHDLKERSVY